MVSINRNFGVKVANTQQPAQEAVTKNDKNGTTLKKPAYPQPEHIEEYKDRQGALDALRNGTLAVGDTYWKDGVQYEVTRISIDPITGKQTGFGAQPKS